MLSPRPAGQRRYPAALLCVSAALLLSASCASDATTSPAPRSPQGSTATPGASPTSPLSGQPAPVDPCGVLDFREIQTVLEGPFTTARQETSGGAAASCIFGSEDGESRIAVTVVKAPVTLPEFQERMRSFGDRAVPVTDLGVPTGLVIFGPTATAYALRDDVQIYIDLVKEDRTGGQITEPLLALMERALSRFPGASPPGARSPSVPSGSPDPTNTFAPPSGSPAASSSG
ncbi:MAG: hypothetical protein H0T04_04895 [Chloroflexi bacterium]|jgi:hypothetical protein|nr:hypothetical protein [Chloroflexota bacterium]MBA3850799.1 hypothetical protein [Chloroflexota bacterium]MDQ3408075.1 hypothetical protein [Chloroflexota bacterium]